MVIVKAEIITAEHNVTQKRAVIEALQSYHTNISLYDPPTLHLHRVVTSTLRITRQGQGNLQSSQADHNMDTKTTVIKALIIALPHKGTLSLSPVDALSLVVSKVKCQKSS